MTHYTREMLIKKFSTYFQNPYVLNSDGTKEYLNLEHIETPSSNVVPEDETLLFVNSGMVQFKNIFLNPESSKLKRTFSIQKCIRAGGKHNDLDDVGMDSYHHTFFEMMGNWSFGDYFKKESILMAYTLLIELGLSVERMYFTYFCKETALKEVIEKNVTKNSEEIEKILENYRKGESNLSIEILKQLDIINNNLKTDIETYEIWKSIVPENRIIKSGMKDNFWEMGETGPCGPCTEIHYDRLNLSNATDLVNTDQNDVIEIWNVVFIEYFRKPNKELELLEHKSVDTGMGLERVLGILNNGTNYDTHLFTDIFYEIGKNEELERINYRIISDHVRTIAISLFYEIDFSNTGRGYVLRRIMRRLLRSYYEVTSKSSVKTLILKAAETLNLNLKEKELNKIEEEIISFNRTLEKGTKKLNELIKTNNEINSANAFDLTTTFGLPLDYLKDICRNKNVPLHLEKYDELMESFKTLSMKDKSKHLILTQSEVLRMKKVFDKTEEEIETLRVNAHLKFIKFMDRLFNLEELKLIKEDQLKELENEECALIFDKTNFYSEKGGQVGDTGIIKTENIYINIFDTQRQNDYTLHKSFFDKNVIYAPESYILKFNNEKRNKIRANHTATHLLNYCLLKQATNKETVQAGSLVNEEKLRFDYEIADFDLLKIENEVNDFIKRSLKVELIEIPQKDLIDIKEYNITKLKNEKYPEIVRIIKIDELLSAELCGGTHVSNTKEIKTFVIQNDASLSKGIRRITAFTQSVAEEYINTFLIAFNNSINSKDLEKIHEKSIPLRYKKEYESKKEAFRQAEVLKSKKFYKRISKIFSDFELKNDISEIIIKQNEEEFVSEKEFLKQFNKLNGILKQKLKTFPEKSIVLKSISFSNQSKINLLFGGLKALDIKENLIQNYGAKINKSGDFYIGFFIN